VFVNEREKKKNYYEKRKKPKSLYTIIPYAIPYINTTPLLLHDFVIEKLLCHNTKYIYKTHPPIPHHALYRQNCYIFEDIIDEKNPNHPFLLIP